MGKYSKLIVRKLKSGKNQGTLKYKDSSGKWGSPTEAAARSGGEAHAARGRGAGLLGEVVHAVRPARPRRLDGRLSHVAHHRRKQPIGTQHLGRGLSEHQRALHPLARAVELDQPAMVHYALDERGRELVAPPRRRPPTSRTRCWRRSPGCASRSSRSSPGTEASLPLQLGNAAPDRRLADIRAAFVDQPPPDAPDGMVLLAPVPCVVLHPLPDYGLAGVELPRAALPGGRSRGEVFHIPERRPGAGARLLPRVRGAQARHVQMPQLFDDAGPAWAPYILRRGNRRRLVILWRKSAIVGVLCSHVARTLPSAPTLRSTVRISSRDRAQRACSERAAPTAGPCRLL